MVAKQHQPVVTGARTVAELLQERARERPDAVGYTYLTDGETEQEPLTYAGADRRARAVAAALREAGAGPGARALLVMVPGLDYLATFFGCLYAGVVAVPAYPTDPLRIERTLPRLVAVVEDAEPVVALTTAPLLDFVDVLAEQAPRLRDLRWVAVDTIDPVDAGDPAVEPVDPGSTAFLQYTSGSTAAPRGVRVSHANLLHNLGMIQRCFRTDADSRAVIWLPPYHDMGLIGGLLQPLHAGCPVTLMSPLHFLEQPMRWLRVISRLGASVSGGPNFAYELCARRATPQEVAELDLSAWEVAFNGAEPIRPETLDRFAAVFAPAGFRAEAFLPCYGLAEATLIVSGAPAGDSGRVRVDRAALARNVVAAPGAGPAVELVTSGSSAPDQRIAVVDPATGRPCPDDGVGEVWVAGPSVAGGYWGRPEETERVFDARLDGEDTAFLRTGDLGFLRDGRLVVTGRVKDVVIVRGQNHYPHDIELTAERSHPGLRTGCSAAFQVPGGGAGDRLVLVLEVRRSPEPVDGAGVAARVREAVAREHGLHVHDVVLIEAGTVPKTSSGKIQRSLCRARYLAGDLSEAQQRPGVEQQDPAPVGRARADEGEYGSVERRLREVVAGLVGGPPAALDACEPLLAAGLDSLAVVDLQHRLRTEFGVALPLGEVLAGASVADVVAWIAEGHAQPVPDPETSRQETSHQAPVVDAAGVLEAPLPHGAREIWLMQQLEPDAPEFTVAAALRLPESVDRAALQAAVDAVVARHPALRTTFTLRGDEPVQVVHPDARVVVGEHDVLDADDGALGRRLAAVVRTPLDLASEPLLRVDLYRYGRGEVLLVRMHHIITDFWSSTIVAREVGAFYSAFVAGREPAVAQPRATHLDVSAWRRSVLADAGRVADLERYWVGQLVHTTPDGRWPRLALPPVAASAGGTRPIALSVELTGRLRARAAAERVTMYVLLLAAFTTVLHRVTGRSDLVVGTPLTGRTRPEFADVVGCCANTMVLRFGVAADEPFRALLERTRRQVIGALEHQDYPMSLIRERHRIGGRGHLVDVLFTVNRAPRATGAPDPAARPEDAELAALVQVGPPGARARLGSLPVETFPLPLVGGTLPIEVVVAEAAGAAHGLLRYRAGSLGAAAADRIVRDYVAVLEQVAADPDAVVADLGPAVA